MFRYFRAINDAAYDQARAALDSAWGYPTADGRTITSFTPAIDSPHDLQGRPYLQVHAEFCEYEAAAALLAGAIASCAVEEVEADVFDSLFASSV